MILVSPMHLVLGCSLGAIFAFLALQFTVGFCHRIISKTAGKCVMCGNPFCCGLYYHEHEGVSHNGKDVT